MTHHPTAPGLGMLAIGRRSLAGAFGLLLAGGATAQSLRVEVWRDPHCGCCGAWVKHLRDEGFAVDDRIVPSVAPIRRMLGSPGDLLSCHAARIAGFALEGHVPALAVRRLLATRPEGIVGLAVPAMPIGSPGMEVPGQPPETYDVIGWRADGSHAPFMRFTGARPA